MGGTAGLNAITCIDPDYNKHWLQQTLSYAYKLY